MNGQYGITDYAQKELGDIVFVDLPFAGDTFNKGDSIGAVESVKTSAQIYTPADVEIIENNEEIESSPQIVNESPTENGWITKIKVTNVEQMSELMSEGEYKSFLETLE
eukprot:CAMPEP_0205802184 /NCGR_PEP_ID=MMETSP0205-20121125/4413_1 /ASSEMBLY_ACC=CAM_ASM_000278 /TAXON_ID=36767 /ORGANISM="Euplotes focardii, Strain TN1" /LENGTH=108 /DNA_ID=CAMNT_0053068159 /DNA_START=145 /DNA_END=471 /DNA_ORIENTATION=+